MLVSGTLLPSPYKISPPTAPAADTSKGFVIATKIGKNPPFSVKVNKYVLCVDKGCHTKVTPNPGDEGILNNNPT